MRYALDTNTVVAALNGVAADRARLASLRPEDVVIPAPAVAELYFGARASSRVRENLARLDKLLSRFEVPPFDLDAARRFALIKAELRRLGRPKQDFDLTIVSIALAHDATIVSHDAALLDGAIPGLLAEDWLAEAPPPNG